MTTPETFDPLDALTIAELDAGSRLLKASLVRAITEGTADYEKAFAVVAYLHARRTDRTTAPDELLKRYTGMRFVEIAEHLQLHAPAAVEDDDDPTEPGRE